MSNTVTDHMLELYRKVRSSDAQYTRELCGFPVTFDLWSYEQRAKITTALNRGKGKHIPEVLQRFGYVRAHASSKGKKYRHVYFPQIYPPLLLNETTDIFADWPADLINQIYLHDVVIRQKRIATKAKITRMLRSKEESACTLVE